MATILDVNLLQSFDFVFVILLVWTGAFAILHKTEALGKNTAINATVAAAVSLLFLLSRTAIDIVNFIIPWFAVAIVFLFLMILIFMMFGANSGDILGALKSKESIQWVLIAIGLIIIVAAFGNVLGQKFLGEDSPAVSNVNATSDVAGSDFEQNVQSTLFHPKIIGLLTLFGVLIFAVALLTV